MTTITGTFKASAIPRCSLGFVSYATDGNRPGFHPLAHANQAIVRSDHEEAVIGLARKQAEDSGTKIALVTR